VQDAAVEMIGIGWIGPSGFFLLCIFFYVILISTLIAPKENELRNAFRGHNTDYQKTVKLIPFVYSFMQSRSMMGETSDENLNRVC
jgi:protein-S-isoprenylcysteine O-methyltransferase Ste14